jgi:uncharacterized membrane protein
LAGIAAVAVLMMRARKEKEEKPAAVHEVKREEEAREVAPQQAYGEMLVTQRMLDVMKALNERERSVVEFLLRSNGKARQSKIAFALVMPKTSLLRALYSLEHRNIVVSEKAGRRKEIALSGWFVTGKEKRT